MTERRRERDRRADWRAARIAHLLAQLGGHEDAELIDFLPDPPPKRKLTPEEQLARFEMMAGQ